MITLMLLEIIRIYFSVSIYFSIYPFWQEVFLNVQSKYFRYFNLKFHGVSSKVHTCVAMHKKFWACSRPFQSHTAALTFLEVSGVAASGAGAVLGGGCRQDQGHMVGS